MQFSKNNNLTTSCDIFILCLRVFTDLSKPNNVRCQSVDLSDIQALGSVYVSLERR